MRFTETSIAGAYLIDVEPSHDERGSFVRTWCRQEFTAHGLDFTVEQCATAYNDRAGTLRGLHYQVAPHEEQKLVRCVRGSVYDVIVDVRAGSASFGRWFAVRLTPSGPALLVPIGCAHGYWTLEDGSELSYHMSAPHDPASSRGIRWNDPTLAISWPGKTPVVISKRDRELPAFEPANVTPREPQAAGACT
ncbi:MAG TPA: dTDP-4-dehydrorhamnose 3,5-epimerase family protein [Pirellulales bacterium]|nr:dTDP-4-dehydrorhamnose 3,5-epimerase family protein [Pirellulales bacterium]